MNILTSTHFLTLIFSMFVCSGGDGNFIISSSLLGYARVLGTTWPMVEDGYGTFYSIESER